jgi:hypothetical protein
LLYKATCPDWQRVVEKQTDKGVAVNKYTEIGLDIAYKVIAFTGDNSGNRSTT